MGRACEAAKALLLREGAEEDQQAPAGWGHLAANHREAGGAACVAQVEQQREVARVHVGHLRLPSSIPHHRRVAQHPRCASGPILACHRFLTARQAPYSSAEDFDNQRCQRTQDGFRHLPTGGCLPEAASCDVLGIPLCLPSAPRHCELRTAQGVLLLRQPLPICLCGPEKRSERIGAVPPWHAYASTAYAPQKVCVLLRPPPLFEHVVNVRPRVYAVLCTLLFQELEQLGNSSLRAEAIQSEDQRVTADHIHRRNSSLNLSNFRPGADWVGGPGCHGGSRSNNSRCRCRSQPPAAQRPTTAATVGASAATCRQCASERRTQQPGSTSQPRLALVSTRPLYGRQRDGRSAHHTCAANRHHRRLALQSTARGKDRMAGA
mmetsp:Transcript_8959/g.24893  ORF Transcript_8959/g.24893 Transcript_8959/m.24893 type:complete len:378 (-) Transcript_8959:45-1178(-)